MGRKLLLDCSLFTNPPNSVNRSVDSGGSRLLVMRSKENPGSPLYTDK